jgi:bacterial/archaeal transporter family-2 protein
LRSLGLLLAFGTGCAVAAQSRINGELGTRVQNGAVAALISFGTGLVLLGLALLSNRGLRRRLAEVAGALRDQRLRPWQLLGGCAGAFFVVCQGVTVTTVGVATFTVAVVSGQLLSSLWVDRVGLGPAGVTPVTRNRAVGAMIAVLAVLLSAGNGLAGGWQAILFAVLPAAAGIGMAWQQAMNGRVGVVGGPVVAASVNFTVGTTALILVTSASVLVRGLPPGLPSEPWLYLGGAIGVLFIATAAVVVRWIGVLLLGLAATAGQLSGALLLDLLVPTGGGLSVPEVAGAALTLVGVGIAAWHR